MVDDVAAGGDVGAFAVVGKCGGTILLKENDMPIYGGEENMKMKWKRNMEK